jgi:hypothetical protein
MIDKLRFAPIEVKLVAAADKYHNLSHIIKTKQKRGTAVWNQFGRGVEQQAWYYRTVFSSIMENLPDDGQDYPIFNQLADLINDLFYGIPSTSPQSAISSR